MKEIVLTKKASFNIDVPCRLIETGKSSPQKPLIVYLHGFNQNIALFEKLVQPMLELEAYHLFIQAPYPIYDRSRQKKVEQWGRSWYLYDGEQDQFVKSLEKASVFLEDVIQKVLQQVSASRVAVFGYSMGGYLGGYFALSRPKYLDELIVVGGRIKTEVFADHPPNYQQLKVLALHGKHDASVKSDPQKKSCEQLARWGAKVRFKEVEEGHKLTGTYLDEAIKWLKSLSYK